MPYGRPLFICPVRITNVYKKVQTFPINVVRILLEEYILCKCAEYPPTLEYEM